jgi:hypothetical protein
MTPLVLGDEQLYLLAQLREEASKHPVNMQGLSDRLKISAHKALHRAQMTKQTVIIPFGFCITYSIEHGHPAGTCRHMSMSSPGRGRMPSPEAVDMIAEQLGFVGGFRACAVWIEDLDRGVAGREKAINLVQPIAITTAEVAHG